MSRWIIVLAFTLGVGTVAMMVAAGATGGPNGMRGSAAAGSLVTGAILLWGVWRG